MRKDPENRVEENKNSERCVALVGPMGSGKSSLLDALLYTAGVTPRRGALKALESGRFAPTALCVQAFNRTWNFIDTVGSVEVAFQTQALAMLADLALVVIEPVLERLPAVEPILRFLDAHRIPHLIFVNKMDHGAPHLREIIAHLQPESPRPLLLRQIPIREGEVITGYVDVISERAYRYRSGVESSRAPLPDALKAREAEARSGLLDTLADFDDRLLEQLLEELPPRTDEVYGHLRREIAEDLVVPVMFGAALHDRGVRRLWKSLRHDTPYPEESAERMGIDKACEGTIVHLARSALFPHTGRLMLGRVWRGPAEDGQVLSEHRLSGLQRNTLNGLEKCEKVDTGAIVLLARLDGVQAGAVLASQPQSLPFPSVPEPVFGLAIAAENPGDDVKLATALSRITDIDPSLAVEQRAESNETILWGQGELHVRDALERLQKIAGIALTAQAPAIPYRETIRSAVHQHARHKRQTGGHGQFADIVIDLAPLPRGGGVNFSERIVGGAVPRQFIPAVEEGVRDALQKGPLGYPVVDLEVILVSGSYHPVDSSELAFRTAAQIAIREALPNAQPVLLEPIQRVNLFCPADATARLQRIVTVRRGHLFGYDSDRERPGWERIEASMPLAEMGDLIAEIRSASLGLGYFSHRFEHLAETRNRS